MHITLWQLLFSFKGRINRTTFWVSITISWVMLALGYIMATSFYTSAIFENIHEIFSIPLAMFLILLPLISVYIQLAITAKRLHDTGRSAWLLCWILATNFIHFGRLGGSFRDTILDDIAFLAIASYFIITCGFLKGNPEPNKYGDPPIG